MSELGPSTSALNPPMRVSINAAVHTGIATIFVSITTTNVSDATKNGSIDTKSVSVGDIEGRRVEVLERESSARPANANVKVKGSTSSWTGKYITCHHIEAKQLGSNHDARRSIHVDTKIETTL
eukprot:2252613-Rhodomonas_salina.1